MNIKAWCRKVYTLAGEKGWHDDNQSFDYKVASFLMNVHSEVSEAWEAYRSNKLLELCDKADVMRAMGLRPLTCLEEELADIVIRTMHYAEVFNVDLERSIAIKHEYNASRPYKHGGKVV